MTINTDVGTDLARERSKRPISAGNKTVAAAAVLTGGGLAAFGLSRRNWAGMGLVAGGAYLAYQGITRVVPYVGAVRVAYTINRSPQDLFDFVRDEQNWPRFCRGIEVRKRDGNEVHLSLGRSAGSELASSVRVTDEKQAEFIAWSSLPGPIEHRGVVHFRPAPGNRGTVLSVAVEYKIAAGAVTQALGMLYGQGPEQLVRENLRRLKQLLESGEIPTIEGQPSGSRGVRGAALRVLYREPRKENAAREARLAGD